MDRCTLMGSSICHFACFICDKCYFFHPHLIVSSGHTAGARKYPVILYSKYKPLGQLPAAQMLDFPMCLAVCSRLFQCTQP